MKSSPPGDLSRLTFDPAKHFTAVVMQQGRVQLDADWNEQVAIVAHQLRTQALDLVGRTGAPAAASGFEIVPRAAFRFDGKSQYLTLGHEPSRLYAAVDRLTLETTIKPRADGGGGTVICRFDRFEAGESLKFTYMLSVLPDGLVRFTRAGSDSRDLLSAAPVPFDRWSRVGLSHAPDRCRLLIDGQPSGSLERGVEPGSEGAFFLVGQAQLQADGPPGFVGSIREIRLSEPTEVGEELLGHWRFDAGDGDVSLDRSSNANHAVLGGGEPTARPTLELDDLLLSAGRFYVNGVACVNDHLVSLTGQATLPGMQLPEDRDAGRCYLFYLDAWERYVAPAQDPDLLEPALGGADTSGRTRVVPQVKWLQVDMDEIPPDPRAGIAEWDALTRSNGLSGRIRVRRPQAAPGTLENRLYRVQVHGVDGELSWKWSRDNGAVVLPISHLEDGSRTAVLGAVGGGEVPVAAGDRIEILDERSILAQVRYPLMLVDSVDDATRSVTFSETPVPGVGTDPALRPVATRWDGAAPLETDCWLRLEHGIEVRFESGDEYRDGDFWTFTSRTGSGTVDWPLDAPDEPSACHAEGFGRQLSPLAVMRFTESGFELRDCRPTFQPLGTGAVSKAGDRMHGPLVIEPRDGSPADEPSLSVAGIARADTVLGALGSPDAVDTFNLAPGAVSRSKIASDVGTVPTGFAILGEHPAPPTGYEATGASLVVPNPDPQWESRAAIAIGDEPGELRSAAVGGRVYTFSSSGRVWAYDPDSGSLVERQPMPETRGRFAAGTVGGRVYLVGGVDHRGNKVAATLEYDPVADAWQSRRDMPTPRCDLGLASIDDKLYALGGLREILFFEVVSRRNEVYDPLVDSWSRRRSLPAARYAVTAAAGAKGVFAFGGRRRWFLNWLGQAISAANDEYLPGVDRWASRPNLMPVPRSHGGAATIGDAVFVVGGRSLFGWTADASRYAPRGDGWESSATLAAPVASPGVASVDGRLVVHAAGSKPGHLEVLECRIASTFHVHRKSAAPESDIEPQARLPESDLDDLAEFELRGPRGPEGSR